MNVCSLFVLLFFNFASVPGRTSIECPYFGNAERCGQFNLKTLKTEMMKILSLLIILLNLSTFSVGQSLSIEETISYINVEIPAKLTPLRQSKLTPQKNLLIISSFRV